MCLTAGLAYFNKIKLPRCKDPYLLPEVWKKAIYDAQYEGINLAVGTLGWWIIPKITTNIYFTPKRILYELESSLKNGIPCILFVKVKEIKSNHTVLAYGTEVENENIRITIYDPNFPLEERYLLFKRDINTNEVKMVDPYYGTIFYFWKIKEVIKLPRENYTCNTDSRRVEIVKTNVTPVYNGVRIDFRVRNNSNFKKWIRFLLDYIVDNKLWSDVGMGLDNIVLEVGEQETINEYWINLL